MMKENLTKALTQQLTDEYYSAYLYLSMSSFCDIKGFKGFANWLHVQAREEMAHAMRIYRYILDRGVLPIFSGIKAADTDYDSIAAVFENVSLHEKSVSASINKIADLAMHEHDHATYAFLDWYVTEQVEEEASADYAVQKIKHIGKDTGMLLAYDEEMSKRVFIEPFKTV